MSGETESLLSSIRHQPEAGGTAQDEKLSRRPCYGAVAAEKEVSGLESVEVSLSLSTASSRHQRNVSKESGFVGSPTGSSLHLGSVISFSISGSAESEDEDSPPVVLVEESQEVETLLCYMETHTSQIEQELRNLNQENENGGGEEGEDEVLNVTSLVLTINTDEEDFDSVEIHSEFVSAEDERKRCKSAFGVLYHLKHEISRLKSHFDSECARLDRFVMGADIGGGGGGSHGGETQRMLTEHSLRGQQFRGRLDACMEEVGQQMADIRRKNEVIIDGIPVHMHGKANAVTGGRRKRSESAINKAVRKSSVSCVTWLHCIVFLLLVIGFCSLYIWNGIYNSNTPTTTTTTTTSFSSVADQWVVCLRLVRSPLMIVFFLYLYAANIKVWAKHHIDYAAVFSHHPDAAPTPRYVLRTAGVLTVGLGLLLAAAVVSMPHSVKIPLKVIPIAMWLFLLAFLLNPCKVFMRNLRLNFLVTFIRISLSPLLFVYFADFFLADQFNSTVGVFLDLQYLACYVIMDPWTGDVVDKKVCTSSANGLRPVLSLLPSAWRFMQCLRCYYNTRKVKHLVNAGKYFSTFPVVLFATFFSIKTEGISDIRDVFNKVSWIVCSMLAFSFIHSVYTFVWDISCDWGLWNLKCTVFDRPLIYRKKAVYASAILLDFVLRFLWTAKLTLAIVWTKDSDLIYTGLVVLEIVRRFVWNFFRVEYADVLAKK